MGFLDRGKGHVFIGLFLALLGAFGGATPAHAEFKVGIVFDKGGKDDKSFNNAAYRGAMEEKDQKGIFVKYIEATDDGSFEPALRAYAQKDFDLIVAIGVTQAEAMQKVAAAFPAKHFAIVDAKVDLPNVRSLMFQEQEGSYLVGALGALMTKTGRIGFVGGMDIPLIRRFQMGYEAGARKINPKIKVFGGYVGVTLEAWNNPPKAKELALGQYGDGADIIYGAAGASMAGLFDAAEETKHFAIGVDSNQNWVKPGFVLTSMLKRVDTAVVNVIEDTRAGKFTGGEIRFGLKNGGIDLAMDKFNQGLIPAEVLRKVDALKAEIIAGKIKVPDYYQKK